MNSLVTLDTSSKIIRVLLADDHTLVRSGLRALLEKLPGVEVAGEAIDDEYVLQALKSGASGYLLKRAATAELPAAFKSVVGGEIYISREISRRFLKKFPLQQLAHATGPLERLTPRQREILQLLADGMSNADVAEKLFISQETVKSHVRHILTKLEADTRTHAVAIALREAIID